MIPLKYLIFSTFSYLFAGVLSFLELKDDSRTPNINLGFVHEFGKEIPENVIYLIRAHLPNMRCIANQIKEFVRANIRSQFKICFVPSQSTVCMHLLEEHLTNTTDGGNGITMAEIWPRLSFMEFKMGFIPYDSDILTLEMSYVFKQCYVDGDLSCLNTIAHALLKMQSIYGIIPNIKRFCVIKTISDHSINTIP